MVIYPLKMVIYHSFSTKTPPKTLPKRWWTSSCPGEMRKSSNRCGRRFRTRRRTAVSTSAVWWLVQHVEIYIIFDTHIYITIYTNIITMYIQIYIYIQIWIYKYIIYTYYIYNYDIILWYYVYIYIIILEEIEYGRIQNMQLKWEYDWKRTYSISCRIINICCIYIYICIYIYHISEKKRTCAYMGQNHSKNNFFVFSVVINSN